MGPVERCVGSTRGTHRLADGTLSDPCPGPGPALAPAGYRTCPRPGLSLARPVLGPARPVLMRTGGRPDVDAALPRPWIIPPGRRPARRTARPGGRTAGRPDGRPGGTARQTAGTGPPDGPDGPDGRRPGRTARPARSPPDGPGGQSDKPPGVGKKRPRPGRGLFRVFTWAGRYAPASASVLSRVTLKETLTGRPWSLTVVVINPPVDARRMVLPDFDGRGSSKGMIS